MEELWGEQPPDTAVKALRVYVSQLRKTLGHDLVETHPSGYSVKLAPGELDADRFEELVRRARGLLVAGEPAEAEQVLAEALALWRGPPLAEFRYEAFARDEIARLEELHLVALEQRLEAELALGRHVEAVPELEALVREHPLRERLRELLMLALYRSGRQADALAAYQDARSTLVEELGLDPGESLQRLEQAILRRVPYGNLDFIEVVSDRVGNYQFNPQLARCWARSGSSRTRLRAAVEAIRDGWYVRGLELGIL